MTNWQQPNIHTRCLRANNPGPMTLEGTNSYVLGAADSATVVVVDPGPLLEDHLQALAEAGTVELILITHHHGDHTDGSARLHQITGAPVRAAHPGFCHEGEPLGDGELIHAAGLEITVLATPGHTSDSVCFEVADDAGHGAVLTGDTVLGQGTTVICHPDGRLGDYLDSLEKLRIRGSGGGALKALPGHGPLLDDLAMAAAAYQEHRRERLAQVRAAVELLRTRTGESPGPAAVAAEVYGDVPANLQGAAQLSVEAQLDFLRSEEAGPPVS